MELSGGCIFAALCPNLHSMRGVFSAIKAGSAFGSPVLSEGRPSRDSAHGRNSSRREATAVPARELNVWFRAGRRGESVGNREQVGAGFARSFGFLSVPGPFSVRPGQRARHPLIISDRNMRKKIAALLLILSCLGSAEARKRRSHPDPERFSDTARGL